MRKEVVLIHNPVRSDEYATVLTADCKCYVLFILGLHDG